MTFTNRNNMAASSAGIDANLPESPPGGGRDSARLAGELHKDLRNSSYKFISIGPTIGSVLHAIDMRGK